MVHQSPTSSNWDSCLYYPDYSGEQPGLYLRTKTGEVGREEEGYPSRVPLATLGLWNTSVCFAIQQRNAYVKRRYAYHVVGVCLVEVRPGSSSESQKYCPVPQSAYYDPL